VSELVVAVVPIRSFRNGKTRLASILSSDERSTLLHRSAQGVIEAALDSRVVDTVLIVSQDEEALAWASEFRRRVVPLRQPAAWVGLNGAMNVAREWALERDADGLLSLFADLPHLSVFDVRALLARRAAIVLGPDRRGEGTNAMLLRLDRSGADFRFAFGERSLRRHIDEAGRLGLSIALHESPGVGFDLDTPLDWAEYVRGGAPASRLTATASCGAACG
jgi:2-phospho-L-lactate guanylyltransferase